jgi:hypothetical protein
MTVKVVYLGFVVISMFVPPKKNLRLSPEVLKKTIPKICWVMNYIISVVSDVSSPVLFAVR